MTNEVMTLQDLVDWAGRCQFYIEIFGDGSVVVQNQSKGFYETYVVGCSLYAALTKAKNKTAVPASEAKAGQLALFGDKS